MKKVKTIKVLIILATLLYLSSIFELWLLEQWASLIPEQTYAEALYWSYRVIIHIHGSWAHHYDLSFLEFWKMYGLSYHVGWTGVFFFQVLTIVFGCVCVFLKTNTRRWVTIVVGVVTALSSVLSLIFCAFHMYRSN